MMQHLLLNWYKYCFDRSIDHQYHGCINNRFHNRVFEHDSLKFLCSINNRTNIGRTSNQFFIKPSFEDRKKSINSHKQDIINIFYKWSKEVVKEPQTELHLSFPLLLPLYTNFILQIEKLDQFGYAQAHLQDNKYVDIWAIFIKLKEKESIHNKEVSEYFTEMMSELLVGIHKATYLMDVMILSQRLKYDEDVEDIAKKSIELGALNQTVGLYTPYLFEYLLKRSTDDKALLERDLKIRDEQSPNGWVFHFLTSNRYLDDGKILAKSNPAAVNDLKILKEILLHDNLIHVTNDLKDFEKQVKEIRALYEEFIFKIDNIIHDYHTLGLKGNCTVEVEFSIKKKISRFFKRERNQRKITTTT